MQLHRQNAGSRRHQWIAAKLYVPFNLSSPPSSSSPEKSYEKRPGEEKNQPHQEPTSSRSLGVEKSSWYLWLCTRRDLFISVGFLNRQFYEFVGRVRKQYKISVRAMMKPPGQGNWNYDAEAGVFKRWCQCYLLNFWSSLRISQRHHQWL